MPVVNYYTVGGEIIGESTGATRSDYMRDALGSVTGVVDSGGALGRSYAYEPFGGLLAATGSGPDPLFGWVGASGYRETTLAHASHYVRLRHYAQEEGRWTTSDPLANVSLEGTPLLLALLHLYDYAGENPVTISDSIGLTTTSPPVIPGPPLPSPSPNPTPAPGPNPNPYPGIGCISITWPLRNIIRHPLIVLLDPVIKIQACVDCYKCDCPNRCTASYHLKVTAGVCVEFKASWTDLLAMVGNAGFLRDLNLAITGITSLITGGLSCGLPSKGCPDKSTNFGAEACGKICALNFEAYACAGIAYKSPCSGDSFGGGFFKSGSRYSNCGPSTLGLCLQVFVEKYE